MFVNDLTSAAHTALENDRFDDFGRALRGQRLPNAFSVVLSSSVSQNLSDTPSSRSIVDKIIRPLTWDVNCYTPHKELSPNEKLLHLLWQDLCNRLIPKLEAAFQANPLATQGAIFCFFNGPALSIIVRYERSHGGALSLQPIAARENVQGVFELYDLLTDASPAQRNSIKAAALSVDKLVYQRGVLIHVSRQRDDVFGPTIDTVVLAEVIGNWFEAHSGEQQITAMEIGCGNGLLSTLLAITDDVSELYAVDLNSSAVSCTLKNLKINEIGPESVRPKLHVRAEEFRATTCPQNIDLVVCNPPYIPDFPLDQLNREPYQMAVGGLGLYREIFGSLNRLLSTNGQLLLMTSSVSLSEVRPLIPAEFNITPALSGQGLRVPLDVDNIWQSNDWREWLLKEGRIEEDEKGGLWHYIQPQWISREVRLA